jgi:hypothetical protein
MTPRHASDLPISVGLIALAALLTVALTVNQLAGP